jgi:hypothetical protein
MNKKEAAPAKGAKGGKKVAAKQVVNDFAYGLVGSDVEAPNFDPLQLSAGRSEETVNWYRSAELKVYWLIRLIIEMFRILNYLITINFIMSMIEFNRKETKLLFVLLMIDFITNPNRNSQ